jgi:hypothetical protein
VRLAAARKDRTAESYVLELDELELDKLDELELDKLDELELDELESDELELENSTQAGVSAEVEPVLS